MKKFAQILCFLIFTSPLFTLGESSEFKLILGTVHTETNEFCIDDDDQFLLNLQIHYTLTTNDTLFPFDFVIADNNLYFDTVSVILDGAKSYFDLNTFFALLGSGSHELKIYPLNGLNYTDPLGKQDDTAFVNITLHQTQELLAPLADRYSKCPTDNVYLNADSSFQNILWDHNLDSNYITKVSEPGIYSVQLTDVNGCKVFDTTEVVNNPSPEIIEQDEFLICNGASVNISLTQNFSNVLWSNGDTSNYITSSNAGSIFVSITDSLGCSYQDTVSVANHSKLKSFSSDTIKECKGQVLNLNESFMLNHSNIGLDSFRIDETNLYAFAYTDTNGCQWNDSLNIVAYDLPSIEVSNDTILCQGSFKTLKAISDGNVDWGNGNDSLTITTPGTFSVSAVNTFGCVAKDSIVIREISPTIDLGPSQTLCEGDILLLSPISNADSFEWNNGSMDSQQSISDSGLYICTGNLKGCEITDSVYIDLFYYPVANFDAIDLGFNQFQFNNQCQYASGHSWMFGDGNSSSTPSPGHQYGQHGYYLVTLVVSNQCGTDTYSQEIFSSPDGILRELELSKKINVFSIPGSNTISINSELTFGYNDTPYRLVNALGQIIETGTLSLSQPNTTIKNQSLETGIYFVTLLVDAEEVTFKVLLH